MRGLTVCASLKIITHNDRTSGGHNWPKTFWAVFGRFGTTEKFNLRQSLNITYYQHSPGGSKRIYNNLF